MNQSGTVAACSRVVVDFDGSKLKPRVVLPKRKEPKTMNYRDFNPDYSCLPAEAYPYLAVALSAPAEPRPTLWGRLRSAIRWLQVAVPVLAAATFLPLADPFTDQVKPDSQIHSLVWVKPLPNKTVPPPPTLPITEGNPYSL